MTIVDIVEVIGGMLLGASIFGVVIFCLYKRRERIERIEKEKRNPYE
ncbi:MAG: hypothetical protein V3T30_02545 [Thermodesulfobacteriota bacterium]